MLSLKEVLSHALYGSLVHCFAFPRYNGARNDEYEPICKGPAASVDERVANLLPRMTIQEKAAQLVQGDFSKWINTTTNASNHSGLVDEMDTRASSFYVGYPVPQQWVTDGVRKAQSTSWRTQLLVFLRLFRLKASTAS